MGGEGFKIWWWEESTGLGDFSRWGGGAGGGDEQIFRWCRENPDV